MTCGCPTSTPILLSIDAIYKRAIELPVSTMIMPLALCGCAGLSDRARRAGCGSADAARDGAQGWTNYGRCAHPAGDRGCRHGYVFTEAVFIDVDVFCVRT